MKCFVIMPFAQEFDDVYDAIQGALSTAVPGETISCLRLDELKAAGRITDDLLRELQQSLICIADVTGHKPNVMWEVGYAMALQKPLLLLTQEVGPLPFDIKDVRAINYQRDSLAKTLRDPLGEAFRQTLAKFEVRAESRRARSAPKTGYTIAVTGSMEVDAARCRRRIETLLARYLGERTTWLCGSFGQADEAAIEYLAANEQTVVVVAYDAFDISPRVLELLEQHNIPFLDAQKEQLPKGLSAPSQRDLLFLTRADLLIVLWSDKSAGIGELLKWYREQQRDVLIGFV